MTWSFWCLAWGSRVLYRKTLDCLGKKVSLANCKWLFYNCFFLFLDCRTYFFRQVSYRKSHFFKISGAIILFYFFWLKPIPVTVMATFGWCSTEKPALFTCPSHVWDRSFGFGPFFLLLGGHPVGYSKCKSAFSISSAPHLLFSPPPTCVQLPKEHVAHSVLNFMSGLGSFLLCNKQLHLSSVFVLFLFLLLYLGM